MLTILGQISRAARRWTAFPVTESGLHGVFKRLANEHGALRTQFWAVVTTSSVVERRQRWLKLRRELVIHERAELQLFRELEWHPGLIELADAKEREATDLMALVHVVDTNVGDEPSCNRAVRELWSTFAQQTETREAYYFPVVQHALGGAMCEALELRYREIRSLFTALVEDTSLLEELNGQVNETGRNE